MQKSTILNSARQEGASVMAIALIAAAFMFIAMFAIKIVPSYIDFYQTSSTIQKVLDTGDIDLKAINEINRNIRQRLDINHLTTLDHDPKSMIIKKEGGFLRIYIDYTVVSKVEIPVMQENSELNLHHHFTKVFEVDLTD